VAAHLFNELEHDITYKKLGRPATNAEQRLLSSVERACKLVDHLVEQRIVMMSVIVSRRLAGCSRSPAWRSVPDHAPRALGCALCA
jgi:hypothetical protein